MIDEKRLEEIRRNAVPLPAGEGYYGLPLLKKPVWTWEVSAYFFVGGTAGAAAVIALTAQITRSDRGIVRDARRIAAAGAMLSAPLLILDLGRPARFLYMLRIFKPQSAMSVGAWTLSAFGAASTAAALFDETIVGNIAAVFSAMTGAVMATYTGVLIGATSIPIWARHAGILPMHFGASATASAASLLQLRGHNEEALRLIATAAAGAEVWFGLRSDAPATPLMRAATYLSGPIPLMLRLLGARSRGLQRVAAASSLAGAILTRFAWMLAGRESADKYHPVSELPPG